MSRAITAIDAGLDYFFAEQRNNGRRRLLRILSRRTLTACIQLATGDDLSPDVVSEYLQQYRQSQRGHATRYQIAGRKYGRAARWHVLAGPKLDTIDGEGLVMSHSEWVVRDAANRAIKDTLHELLPNQGHYPVLQQRIVAAEQRIRQALDGLVRDHLVDKEQWEQSNNRRAPLDVVESVVEQQFVLDLEERAS